MAIPILGEIEKLINEHGSAVILKERIALANDKYTALEKELSASNTRVAELEMENQSLKLDNEKLRQEIQRRDDIIKQEKSHKKPLDKQKVNILKLLFDTERMEINEIAQSLNLGLQFVKYHLEELLKLEMVIQLCFLKVNVDKTGNPSRTPPSYVEGCTIAQKGRKYLIDCEEVA